MMTIQNRTSFLNHIATQLQRPRKTTVEKPDWQHQPQLEVLKDKNQDELVEVLKDQCHFIHTSYKQVTLTHLDEVMHETIQEFGDDKIIVADDERNNQYQLKGFYEKLSNNGSDLRYWGVSKNAKEDLAFAEEANIGITFSDITLAESGTVVLLNNKGNGRAISLLPENYIAIIPKSTIVPRMTQATKQIQEMRNNDELLPSCISFISGPSNSADIELNLIVGVHGPVRATYIIVEDA